MKLSLYTIKQNTGYIWHVFISHTQPALSYSDADLIDIAVIYKMGICVKLPP
jgi:hypothetical protein